MDPELVASAKIAIAGLCGGYIRLIFRPARTWRQYAALLVACGLLPLFFTAPTLDFFGWARSNTFPVAAGIGLVGLSIVQAILKALDKLDLSGWLPKKGGS